VCNIVGGLIVVEALKQLAGELLLPQRRPFACCGAEAARGKQHTITSHATAVDQSAPTYQASNMAVCTQYRSLGCLQGMPEQCRTLFL
jgi:hypothetical protein